MGVCDFLVKLENAVNFNSCSTINCLSGMRTLFQEGDMSEISTEAKNIKNCLLHYLEVEGMIKGKENRLIASQPKNNFTVSYRRVSGELQYKLILTDGRSNFKIV